MTTRQTLSPDTGRITDVSRFLARYEITIRVVAGSRQGAEYPLRRPRLTIGRDKEADLVFLDDTMSKVHAAVEFRDGNYHLLDLESRNGTRLNGQPVIDAALKDGDRFEVGGHAFVFTMKDRHPPSVTRNSPARG
jgi:pSer/pThr/pTyr-binding forkhead associated (FHA) protein